MAIPTGYTAVLSNTAGGKFTITSDGVVHPVGAALDYETAVSHAVEALITRTSDGQTKSIPITIPVTDINENVGPVTLMDIHSRGVFVGDSYTALGSMKGARNYTEWTLYGLPHRRAVGGDQGKGGDTMLQILARIDNVTKQKPHFVVGHYGHNDSFGIGQTEFMKRWDNIYVALRSALPDAHIFLLQTLPSQKDDVSVRPGVWAAQMAYDGRDGGLTHVMPVPQGYDPTPGVHAADTDGHPSPSGARDKIAADLIKLINQYTVPWTRDDLLNVTTASSRFGGNLDTYHNLLNKAGAKTGTVVALGDVATGRRIVNGLSVAPVASKIVPGGDYEKQQIVVSGTPSAAASVVFDYTANVSMGGSFPGQFYETLFGYDVDDGVGGAPVGFRGLSLVFGSLGTGGTGADTSVLTDLQVPTSGIYRSSPIVTTSSNASVNSIITLAHSAVANTVRHIFDRPLMRRIELLAYAAPFYLGNDNIRAPSAKQRIAGTGVNNTTNVITAATANTIALSLNPGTWSGGALGYTRRILVNGAEVYVQGPSSTTWTWTPNTLAAGDVVKFEVTSTNTIDSAVNVETYTVN